MYSGKRFDEANDLIVADMEESGALLYKEEMLHSYLMLPLVFNQHQRLLKKEGKIMKYIIRL